MTNAREKIFLPLDMKVEFNNAITYQKQGNLIEAQKKYEYILESYPNNTDTLSMLGTLHCLKENFTLGVKILSKAIKNNNKNEKLYNNRGLALVSLGKHSAAIIDYKKAILLNSEYIDPYNNYGLALKELNQWENAINILNNGIGINSKIAELHLTRGIILRDLKRFEESELSINKAIAINKNYSEAYYTKSLTLLTNGNLEQGWKLYEYRWKSSNKSKYLKTNKPLWNNTIKYKTILVWKEQGLGDEIMCSSLINNLAEHCSKLYVLIDKRLKPLYERSFSNHIIFLDTDSSLDNIEYDAHIPINSLPLYFKTDPNDYTNGNSFLIAELDKTKKIKKQIPNENNKKICGISWKGGTENNGHRNIDLLNFIKLLNNDNIIFVNLQYGETLEEINYTEKKLGIKIFNKDLIDNKNDLDSLASLIEACDMVVTVDNATVHLAGGLGKETHLLLSYTSDFRWMTNVDRSIWYKSLTLYRQERDLRWNGALKAIKHNIQ